MTVLCLGEMMAELALAADGSARMGFGGDTFNTAAYLSRLGQKAAYLTAFGDDPWSTDARALLAAEKVDASASPVAAGRTLGLYAIRTSALGERSFTYWRDSAPARDLFGALFSEAVAEAILSARLVYLSGITLWLYDAAGLDLLFDLLAQVRARGAQVAFDGNYRPRLWGPDRDRTRSVYARMLALTDICLATFDDEALLWNDRDPASTLLRLRAMGAGEVVVKCGPDGALFTPGHWARTTPNPAPVDTTAAGDSFNAAYLARRLSGLDAEAAAQAGNRLAGRVIAHRGALIPLAEMT
jgi:2-dehydro-3-deoxygluconokinase